MHYWCNPQSNSSQGIDIRYHPGGLQPQSVYRFYRFLLAVLSFLLLFDIPLKKDPNKEGLQKTVIFTIVGILYTFQFQGCIRIYF